MTANVRCDTYWICFERESLLFGRSVGFIVRNSKVQSDRFRQLMLNSDELISDFGTVLLGEDAVKEGLIDNVGSLSDALKCLYDMTNQQELLKEQEFKFQGSD